MAELGRAALFCKLSPIAYRVLEAIAVESPEAISESEAYTRRPIGLGAGAVDSQPDALYGGERNLITFNMSEFQESHTISTLKGAPPGYVGYGEGGVLTEAVRRKPYCVVLLDEIDKAHHDVHSLFYQVFDKGLMEDGQGRMVDFRNTVILLTTNRGDDAIARAWDGAGGDERIALRIDDGAFRCRIER